MIRKFLKKNTLSGISVILLSFILICSSDISSQASEVSIAEEIATSENAITRSAIIEWRYKVVGGVLYRRLYNYTEQCWVGDWEVVPLE